MTDHLIEAIQSGYTTVKVQYDKYGQLYTFKITKTLAAQLEVGNLVLIESPQGYLRSVTIKVIDVLPDIDYRAKFDYKWVIGKIDLTDYLSILSQELILKDRIKLEEKQLEKEKVRVASGFQTSTLDTLYELGKYDSES